MNKSPKLPPVDASSLQEHGSDPRIERIWSRLQPNLEARPSRPRAALWWAPAAAVIVFGAGVFVGSRWTTQGVEVATPLTAEPVFRGDEAQAAPASPSPAEVIAPPEDPHKASPVHRAPRAVIHTEEEPSSLVETPLNSPPTLVLPPAGPPDWQHRAKRGEYAAAARLVEQQGGFPATIARSSAEQLMILVEVARATGQRPRAIEALRRVLEQFPSDPNAPLAALTLGNLLEASGDRAGAQKAFAAYRSLSPKGDFAEDALVRQVEAATEQGDLELARKLLEQYEKDFPTGRRLRELKAQLAKKSGKAEPAVPAAPVEEDETPASDSEEDELGASDPASP